MTTTPRRLCLVLVLLGAAGCQVEWEYAELQSATEQQGADGGAPAAPTPNTCPPSIASQDSCADLLTEDSCYCDADGNLTTEGRQLVSQCNRNGVSECGYYLAVRGCYDDCSACERNRLDGYYQTCRNMTQLARGGLTRGGSDHFTSCDDSCEFQAYVSEMRRCLQDESRAQVDGYNGAEPIGCSTVVEGTGGINDGIIGSHTTCNAQSGFCDLGADSLECFGAALGDSWGGMCLNDTGHSPYGSWRSVGLCHLMSQAMSCSQSGGSAADFIDNMCTGYQAGCMLSQPQCGPVIGATGLPSGGIPQDIACKLACPTTADLERLRGGVLSPVFNIHPWLRELLDLLDGALDGTETAAQFEAACVAVIGRDSVPGEACAEPNPAEECCCERGGASVAYNSPQACRGIGGTPDTSRCNLRGFTTAMCNAPPSPPERTGNPTAADAEAAVPCPVDPPEDPPEDPPSQPDAGSGADAGV